MVWNECFSVILDLLNRIASLAIVANCTDRMWKNLLGIFKPLQSLLKFHPHLRMQPQARPAFCAYKLAVNGNGRTAPINGSRELSTETLVLLLPLCLLGISPTFTLLSPFSTPTVVIGHSHVFVLIRTDSKIQ